MAFNLFDQFNWKSSIQSFLGNKQPEKPSFIQPTSIVSWANVYTQPIKKQQPSIVPQVNAWVPLVSDSEIEQMVKAWATDDEILKIITELETERGWAKPQQPVEEKPMWESIKSWAESFWVWAKNVIWWAISEIPEVAWKTAKFVWDFSEYNPLAMAWAWLAAPFSKKTYWEIRNEQIKYAKWWWEILNKAWTQWKEFVQKSWLYDPNSTWAKVWEIWTDILATIAWPWKIFKTAEKANLAIRVLAWLANTSLQWTTSAVSNYVATEWRLPTPKEVAEYIAIWAWMKAWWKAFEQVKKLPSARLIPTTITEAWKDIRKWIDIWEAISKTGISFTKSQLARKINKKVTDLSTKIDDAINSVIKKSWPNNVTISSLTTGLKKEILNDSTIKAQLKWTPIQMKQIEEWIDETIDAYKSLYKNKKFDLNAQQQLKKDIYSWLENVFNKNFQTTGKITAQQATERQLARKLRENIETKVPEVIQLNKQLAPFLEAWKRLWAKWWYSWYLTDILAWWFASWSPTWIISDPVGYAKNFLLWVIAKRAWTSTLAKTTASTLSANLEKLFKNTTFQNAIKDQYRRQFPNE
jgi:hypothetical protein